MSINNFELWRSKDTVKRFKYDPKDSFTNVIVKYDDKGKFVAATLLDPRNQIKPQFIEPGQDCVVNLDNEETLVSISPERKELFENTFEKIVNVFSIDSEDTPPIKPGNGTGGN